MSTSHNPTSHNQQTTKLTYDDYALIPDDGMRHEIIEGRHYMNPAPSPRHQTISRRIQFQLYQQIELAGRGQVFNAPIDLQLSDFDVVQPDLVVVLQQNQIITPTRIRGVPDLVVEILSSSNQGYDREVKKRLYQRHAVPAYWIVDPECDSIEQNCLDGAGKYEVRIQRERIRSENCLATVDLSAVWAK